MRSPPQAKFDHDQQHQHLLQQEDAKPYDGQGLNTAAVSTGLQPQKAVVKNKPPQVVPVAKKNERVKSQVRHSYTARLRLSIKKFKLGLGLG